MKRTFFTYILAISSITLWQDGRTESISEDPGASLCPQSLDIPARPFVDEVLESEDIHLSADEADLVEEGISHLRGNAEVTRGSQQVRADHVEYNQPQDTADMEGDVHYWDDALFLHSNSAHLEFEDGTGQFQGTEFIIKDNRGRGRAEELVLDIGTKTDLQDVDYTTCDPDDNFWKLSASKISLDHVKDWGRARNVVLRIKNVPVFYSPYMSFPLSKKRKTGFLTPGFGSTNKNGVAIRTPFYWNIAPQMDATLTPRYLDKKGLMLMGEYRYLLSGGSGHLHGEYLPNDDDFGDEDRSLFGFTHEQRFAGNSNLFLTYNRVSDKNYFEDFGTQLSLTSTRYLERRAEASYNRNWWNLTGRVQDYQTVDRSIDPLSRPYKRLPQIMFNANSPARDRHINYGMTSEAVYFNRDNDALLNNVNGLRFDLYPYVSYPINTVSSYLKPKLGVRFTQYNLSDRGSFQSSPNRLLPILSLDGGMFFERDLTLFNKGFLQTLEPRVYYLYIPEEDQTDLPVFDTGLFDFSFDSLFREDRFSGPDRMGDANQMTLAVTSYLINQDNGRSAGYISLAQIYYLEDREVSLPGGKIREESSSPIVAELGTTLVDNWTFRGDIQWDPNGNGTEKLTTHLRYNPSPGKVLNIAYRVRRDTIDIEQSDLSFRWPLNPKWSVVGRWNYAVPEARSLEIFGGVEYESCCWGVRAVARRYLTDIDGDFETGVFLQLELKGLAGIGRKTVDYLKQKIPGYRSEF